jgi:polyisoprenoid-binding protein YceI
MLLRTLAAATLAAGLTTAVGLRPAPVVTVATAAPTLEDSGDPFTIDHVHSTMHYHLRHFGVSNFWGRINQPKGAFRIDDADLASSHVRVEVEVKNMDAGNDGRNRFLMSPDFFNVREYPTARFESTSIRKIDDDTYEADGTFLMHGVTQSITVLLDQYTAKQTVKFGYRAGFECRFTVKRSDYGMDLFVKEGTLGDEVTIIAAIEGVQRPE